MSLRMKFNLVLAIATLVGISVASFLGYQLLQQNAREEVLDSARIMLQSAMSMRAYTISEVKPLLALQQKRQFMPQTVPAYSARKYVEELQKQYPEYSYREATLNPTNPVDRASDWEADIVHWFRNNGDTSEVIGERDTPTGRLLYLSRPIKITNPACLACHSTPANAPPTMLAMYGEANGFGWKQDEIVGAQIVSVPMSLPLQRAERTFIVFMASLLAVFGLIAILLNVMLHYVVIKPVKAMAARADEVSMGALNAEEIEVKGSDEIASLGHSFNRMHRSLANALRMLE